jgi:hypothetical protein
MLSIIKSHISSFTANHFIGSEAIEINDSSQKLKDYLSTNFKDSFKKLYGIEIDKVLLVEIRYEGSGTLALAPFLKKLAMK